MRPEVVPAGLTPLLHCPVFFSSESYQCPGLGPAGGQQEEMAMGAMHQELDEMPRCAPSPSSSSKLTNARGKHTKNLL